jgi:hypothetical protein
VSPLDPEEEEPPAEGEGGLISVPSFQSGGYVARTGIALVHQGEYVQPATGSEAVISTGSAGMLTGQVLNYYFPVEVQIVGTPSRDYMRQLAEYVYDELLTALASV